MPDHDEASPRSAGGPRLSRRGVLQAGGVALGGLGASALVAYATGGRSGLSLAPVAVAAAADPSAVAAAADPSAVPARDPSPMDFAVLPPARPQQAEPVEFTLTGYDGPDQTILIAPGHPYVSMNFDGQVPAPTLRVTEGDVVRFTLHNAGAFQHSIDFHAAQTSWSANYQSIDPGASFTFEWTAHHPGAFMYHCGTPAVIMHIGDGMYGAVIVDPAEGRPAAREYVIVQSEFYGAGGDINAMLNAPPDVVCFNGQGLRYQANPLPATVGEIVRLFVVNAGPNSSSAFHVIGALFDRYEPDGNPANAMGMHQTINVPPGDGAMVELTFDAPGQYPFVTHRSLRRVEGSGRAVRCDCLTGWPIQPTTRTSYSTGPLEPMGALPPQPSCQLDGVDRHCPALSGSAAMWLTLAGDDSPRAVGSSPNTDQGVTDVFRLALP